MESENCKLLTPYKGCSKLVEYEYDGMPYKVSPTRWNLGARPHKAKCIRYTQGYVEKLVRLNEWLYIKARPHLEKVILDYKVPSNVEATYEQQQPIE
ncbi:MAG: hypothetical protein EZS28_017810 [Streblomastix strix]|uniref:Uncharacterized protein n=1 Tax=Streblomastix strix TaxID=222440 RepID=A0A5J4VVZ6_9EUKA|nr:MAG: hypothetical protein EZS28_017810 [Streblomastix strix]